MRSLMLAKSSVVSVRTMNLTPREESNLLFTLMDTRRGELLSGTHKKNLPASRRGDAKQ